MEGFCWIFKEEVAWLVPLVSKIKGCPLGPLVLPALGVLVAAGALGPCPHPGILEHGPHLTCRKIGVGIEAEDGVRADRAVREEAVTDLQ